MEIDVYTDASIRGNSIQVSSFVIDEHDNEYHNNQKVNVDEVRNIFLTKFSSKKNKKLTVSSKNTVLFEMYSIWLVLSKFKDKKDVKINIYTDNMFSFDLLNGLNTTEKFISLIARDIKNMKLFIDVRWIKGHAGVYGNEHADRLTRSEIKNTELNFIN